MVGVTKPGSTFEYRELQMIITVNTHERKIYQEGIDGELRAGTVVEHEHRPTYNWLQGWLKIHGYQGKLPPLSEFARHIAIDHLNETRDYYTRLATIIDDVPEIK